MKLRKDLPLQTKVIKMGCTYGFQVPKALIDISYFKKGVKYRIWVEEVEE